jgi:D-alanyl-D-alanine carboxypeptidase
MAGPYDGLNPSFAGPLQAFINASGGKVRPGSGYRSFDEQAVLYNNYKNGVPGQARAARPGHSQHNFGMAMDLTFGPGGVEWAHQHAAEFGLAFPMDDENWHVQLAGTPAGVSGGGGGDPKHNFKNGLIAAGIDPQDELASRLHQIMQVIGGANSDQGILDDSGNAIGANPLHKQYVNQMFSGGATLNDFPKTMVTDTELGPEAKGRYQKYAMKKMQQFGWGPEQFKALDILWGQRESGWDPTADNDHSSAAGIAQKMQSVHGPVESTGEGQIDWGLQYILNRYGSPANALAHSTKVGWY